MDQVRDMSEKVGKGNIDFRDLTKDFADEIQGRLIDGVLRGHDINGQTFKGIKESTKNIRKKFRGHSGTAPLRDSGGLLDFLNSSDLLHSGNVQITLKEAPEKYDVHNEGHTVPPSEFNDRLNLTGRFVPARKWYGIPKTYREGGTKYNELLKRFVKRIEEGFKRATKAA